MGRMLISAVTAQSVHLYCKRLSICGQLLCSTSDDWSICSVIAKGGRVAWGEERAAGARTAGHVLSLGSQQLLAVIVNCKFEQYEN